MSFIVDVSEGETIDMEMQEDKKILIRLIKMGAHTKSMRM
jgi:hypothetical protein